MVSHGEHEGHCPACGEEVGQSEHQCPKCQTPINENAPSETPGQNTAEEGPSSPPGIQEGAQCTETTDQTSGQEQDGRVHVVDGEKSAEMNVKSEPLTDENKDSDSTQNPDHNPDENSGATVEGESNSPREELPVGHQTLPANDFSLVDATVAGSDMGSEEDFYDAEENVNGTLTNSGQASSDSSSQSMTSWEVVNTEEVQGMPSGGSNHVDTSKSRDVLLDSEIDAIAEENATGRQVEEDESCDKENLVVKEDVCKNDDATDTGMVAVSSQMKQEAEMDESSVAANQAEAMNISEPDPENVLLAEGQPREKPPDLEEPKLDADVSAEGQPGVMCEDGGVDMPGDEAFPASVMDDDNASQNRSDYEMPDPDSHGSVRRDEGRSGVMDGEGGFDMPEDDNEMDDDNASKSSGCEYGIAESMEDTSDLVRNGMMMEEPVLVMPTVEDSGSSNMNMMQEARQEESVECSRPDYSSSMGLSADDDPICHGDLSPPLCDGVDSDGENCTSPVTETKRCSQCGQKNKFVRCKEVHDDGTPCAMFIKRGGPCKCCEAIKAAKEEEARQLALRSASLGNPDYICRGILELHCDGVDSDDEACTHPISADWKRCPNCGTKNNFIRCQKTHEDGTPCSMLFKRGQPCPCCVAADAASKPTGTYMPPVPPVCDGEDDGNPCNRPIEKGKFCSNCGQKNKYVECQGQNEDGSLCMMFILPGKKCPWCHSSATAPGEKTKKPVLQEKVKDTELRAKPAKRLRRDDEQQLDGSQQNAAKVVPPCSKELREKTTPSLSSSQPQSSAARPTSSDSKRSSDATSHDSLPRAATPEPGSDAVTSTPEGEDSVNADAATPMDVSSEDAPQDQCHVKEVELKEPAVEKESLQRETGSNAEREPGNAADRTSDVTNAGIFATSASITLSSDYENHSSGDGGSQQDRVFGTHDRDGVSNSSQTGPKPTYAQVTSSVNGEVSGGQESEPVGGSHTGDGICTGHPPSPGYEQHCLAYIDDESKGRSGGEGDSGGNVAQEMSGDSKRKREHEDSNKNTTDEKGQKPKEAGSWYRKGDNPPEEYSGSSHRETRSQSKKAKGAENAAAQKKSQTPTSRKVRFHVVVHRHFKFDEAKDNIVIRFGSDCLGGFSDPKNRHKMNLVRKYNKGYALMELEVQIPNHITEAKYKYVHLKPKDKVVWEYLPEHSKDQKALYHNRSYKANFSQVESNKYDGLMYPPPPPSGFWENVGKNIKKFLGYGKKEIADEVKDAATVMLPRWHWFFPESAGGQNVDHGMAEEFIQKVDQVFTYLETSFSNMDEEYKKKVWKELVWDYLTQWQTIVSNQLQGHPGNSTPEASKMRLVSALTVLRLIVRFKALLADEEHINLLCECLLLRPHADGTILPFFEILNEHFENPRSLIFPLLLLCKRLTVEGARLDNDTQQKWLFVVPLIHFLNGDAVPYNEVLTRYGVDHAGKNSKAWWGLELFQKYQECCKWRMASSDGLKLEYLFQQLQPLFHMDHLLPRTLTSVLSLHHIKSAYERDVLPLGCMIANVFYFIRSKKNDRFSALESDVRHMIECLHLISAHAKKTYSASEMTSEQKKEFALKEVQVNENLAWDLLQLLIRITSPRATWHAWGKGRLMVPIAIQLMITVLDAHHDMTNWISKDQEQYMHMQRNVVWEYFEHIKCCTIQWLHENLESRMTNYIGGFADASEPQIWSDLLGIEFASDHLKMIWRTALLGDLEIRISKLSHTDQIEMYCGQTDFSRYERGIEETFSKMAFAAMSKEANFLYKESYNVEKYKRLLSHMFRQLWRKAVGDGNDPEKILNHLLSWPSFERCLEIFSTEKREMLFDIDCIECITIALSILSDKKDKLMKHELSVSEVEFLLQHQEAFTSLCSLELTRVDHSKLSPEQKKAKRESIGRFFRQFFQLRQFELDYFRQTRDRLLLLMNHCRDLPCDVHIETLHDSLTHDINEKQMYEVVEPAKEPYEGGKVPNIRLFGMPKAVLGVLDKVKALSSIILNNLWIANGRNEQDDMPLDLDEAVRRIWQPSWTKWSEVASRLHVGNITLREVDEYFGCFKRKMEDIRIELECMRNFLNETPLNVEEIMKQIDLYYKLETYMKGAGSILRVKEEMELKGDFSRVQTLANVTEHKDQLLRKMDANLLKTGEILRGIKPEEVECLNAVAKCKKLVKWLRDIGGTKELKVFVDLASTSAGEGDMDMDRVSMLHAVVTGYAPIICDLKENASAEVFLEHCKMVWRALESDPKLTEKLGDINRNLPWLQFVKDSHGSIEVSSLSEVTAINARGIYKVGNLNRGHQDVRDVIQLNVPGQDKDSARKYNFDQLNELQSKLMLMSSAKKGNKEDSDRHSEIDRFTEIFEGVTRLAKAFIKICSAGNVLFQDWVSILYCSLDKKNNVRVDFQLENEFLMERNEELQKQIHRLANFMENCLGDWQDYLVQQRAKYPQLNHFTTAQIVILRKEFAKVTSEDIDNLTYAMLQNVRNNCRRENLIAAVKDAHEFLEKQERGSPQKAAVEDEVEEEMPAESAANFDELKEELMGAGFSEKLVCLAIKERGLDKDECMVWCFENGDAIEGSDSDDDDGDRNMEVDDAARFHDLEHLQPGTSMRNVRSELLQQLDKNERNLCDQLKDLWERFLGTVSMSVKDYRSVEHLGLILDRLSDREERKIVRTLPPFLKSGQPNLIVCPEANIYNAVLSLYMNDPQRPLPTDEEVLLCTKTTTAEEVELLWQRATCDQMKQGKIFSLVNADRLDYDVSDSVEKSLEKHIKGKKEYNLVIICSSEREDKSRMVTALDRDRRNAIIRPAREIVGYLTEQFSRDFPGEQSAPSLDYEKCSVRLVKSSTAGVGKTLVAEMMSRKLKNGVTVRIPLHERYITESELVDKLIQRTLAEGRNVVRLFHIDIGHDVIDGVDHVLFNLLVLRCIKDANGRCWRRSSADLYLIENLPLLKREVQRIDQTEKVQYVHRMLNILPSMTCRPPKETLRILRTAYKPEDYKRDDPQLYNDICTSKEFQRPYRYLKDLEAQGRETPPFYWLDILLRYCGVENPSWAELRHFISFLNIQLEDCEHSIFCHDILKEDLPGFTAFVVRFMIQMSKDFATRSLDVSEETPQLLQAQDADMEVDQHDDDELPIALRRRWETSPHPYIFFNPDHHSITFLGFNIDKKTGNLIDLQTNTILQENIMSPQLFEALERQDVNLLENFDLLSRADKIIKLCTVMGTEVIHDPDVTYELTTDNVKKMLAIYMRFRCNIPVVVMGETGCGKTRLIKFMCDLQVEPGVQVRNMILMKVHGGTTNQDIIVKVRDAQALAIKNRTEYPRMDTILFFDEANTTEAIGLIKEIMCDGTMNGERINATSGLKFVAACNPYRKHSPEMIKNLEKAGLGYNVKADQTADKLGRIPMRQLVYRVQPLPQSMLPLVWDFGQLNDVVEKMYINQIVLRYIEYDDLPKYPNLKEVITNILAASQGFMREQKNECSFVSLRDVERTMTVMAWFYRQRNLLFKLMDGGDMDGVNVDRGDGEEEDESEDEDREEHHDDVTRSLILALGVCYHACLQEDTRVAYRDHITGYFQNPCRLPNGADSIRDDIDRCQEVFLREVGIMEPNIAPNQALKENLFMMVICIELRIPLFLVGKPGSSKSLAKLIVTDAMQGETAKSSLFKALKQVHMVSFQCSPLATPEGIKGTFKQCARFQKDKNLDKFVSVVVLDEVGLAEDSPRMPLKTLHPLLEDGTSSSDEEPLPHKKVAFIGISNWALDPAKMNRGILVQRGVPDEEELIKSAVGICSTDEHVLQRIRTFIPQMARAYLELYTSALEIREFFGLRDFYSLVKMIYAFAHDSRHRPTWYQVEHAIRRNFGGLQNTNPVEVFQRHLDVVGRRERPGPGDPPCDPTGLIQACLYGHKASKESRYLLILTENYAALGILQQQLLTMQDTIVIFGSSFRSDQEYTQVCRNINRIKKCMDTGKTVVLLNLESLYESLYDALNQYYVYMGGQRYVDLGLGTHRVKCRVDENFRLIVVAEKDVVYEKFPIPLINRLEKHFLAMTTVLGEEQMKVVQRVEDWANKFVTVKQQLMFGMRPQKKLIPGDVFCGYHADTAASVVLQVSKALGLDYNTPGWARKVYDQCLSILLACATPDSVLRLKNTQLDQEEGQLGEQYFRNNDHQSLQDHLRNLFEELSDDEDIFVEVTTRSHLLAKKDAKALGTHLKIRQWRLLTLQAMDTKQQFSRELRDFMNQENDERLMLLQCDSGDQNSNLIACARFQIMEEYNKAKGNKMGRTHIVFIIQMPRVVDGTFIGFQGGKWHSVHLDDLRPPQGSQPSVMNMKQQSIGSLVREAVEKQGVPRQETVGPQAMEMDTEGAMAQDPETPMAMEVSDSLDPEQIKLLDLDDRPRQPTPEELERGLMQRAHMQESESMEFQTTEQPAQNFDTQKEVLDVDALIHSALQAAASMIKDPETVPADRPTRRLQILSKELSRQDSPSLMDALKVRISQLLQEKEKAVMIQSFAQDWLSKEAAAIENINRAGTLSQAIQMVIERKTTPTLAGLIAYLDTNGNLDILQRRTTPRDNWINTLWLKMLSDTQATQLSYERLLLSPTSRTELTEMTAQQTGAGHVPFDIQFPFSWEVYRQMEVIIQTAGTMEDENQEQTCQRLFNDSAVGKLLKEFLNDKPVVVQDEMVDLYLSDFVHMTVRCGHHGMHEIFTKTLKVAFRESRTDMAAEDDDLAGQLTIPKLHLTYLKFHKRFEIFIQACSVWKKCVEWLNKTPGHDLNTTRTEMTLDVNILVKMVDYISTLEDMLKIAKDRQKWIDTVKAFKPVIESILNATYPRGPICMQYLEQYRPLWTRICVVRLFIDHVCPPHIKEEKGRVDSIKPLWGILGKDTSFRTPASLQKVAKFLKSCKFNVVKKLYKSDVKCIGCEEPMKDPVVLPCSHRICRTCFKDLIDSENRQCLQCKAEIPEGFTPPPPAINRERDKAYNEYIRACNEFFMDLVSQLCFAEDHPPSHEVIEILMSFVIHQPRGETGQVCTKELTVYEESIDPTPVLRSHLLQLLLRYSPDEVRGHLQHYFERSQRFLKDPEHIIQLSLLCVRCFEDSYHSLPGLQPGSALQTRVENATNFLLEASRDIGVANLDITKIEAIAKTRFGMSVAADMMHRVHVLKEENLDVKSARRLWASAEKLHEASESKWPRLYLVKQLCRNYGMECFEQVTRLPYLAWVVPDEAKGREDAGVDRFILFGEHYKTVRDAVGAVLIGGAIDQFRTICEGLAGNKQMREVSCILALHREVYTHNLFEQNPALRITDQVITNIQGVCLHQAFIANQQAVNEKLEGAKANRITPVPGNVDRMTKDIWDLLTQTTLVMQSLQESPLLKPYMSLMQHAAAMRGVFLPTMPQDHLEEAREALLAARNGGGENPVFYTCSRGHPYVIGNCGRPAMVGRCWCGSEIGGIGYQLREGNVRLDHRDNTQRGYVLGAADMRNLTPVPERALSPAATTILRLLLHLAMHIGTKTDPQGVAALIQPPVQQNQVNGFLLDHIRHDIQVLGRAINKSPDDCLSLITMLVGSFMKNKKSNARFNTDLTTKEARRDWERAFTETYINPLLNDLDNILHEANTKLVNDDRLSNNPLIKIVHEMINLGDGVDINEIHDCQLMWQFRRRVTVEHLTQLMNENAGEKCEAKILRQFLQEEHELRLLSRLPGIIRLQQLMIQQYQRRINQAEARATSIKQMMHDLPNEQRTECIVLLDNFTQAWNSVRGMLLNYNASGYTLPEEMCNMSVLPNSPVAMLIPSFWGLGLCSVMLVEYLTRKQNEFIMAYCRYRKKDSSSLPQFVVKEATSTHLIYYDPEKDLLPMVLAHCNYSLEVGKGTVITYDFIGLERELEERFLRGKPKLVFDIPTMVFKTEYRNAMVIFEALRGNIPQEPMSHAVQSQILQENRAYPDLCDTIACLDITIAWLRDVRGDADTKLVTFMHETLRMSRKVLSPQIQQHCLLKHVESLWLILSMERAKQLKYFNQDAFEDVAEVYHEALDPETVPALKDALTHLNIDRFVTELFECILLKINIQQNQNDEDFQDNTAYSLALVLSEFINAKDGTEMTALTNGIFPREIQVKQAIEVWSEAVRVQRKEEQNRRR